MSSFIKDLIFSGNDTYLVRSKKAGITPLTLFPGTNVPATSGDGTTVFATNLRVGPDEAEAFCRRYSRRWQIENEYKSIKGDFLAKTSSKDYRVRLFSFVRYSCTISGNSRTSC